ncbi:hypothetical protein J3A72_003216 [Stenotrophomonas sp. PvP093]|uniref:Uncharacterized protein n=1 Tax=Stenotrophomonas pavanii TaxID=487698 RepID=A0A2D0AP38_9GAMM|nr:MULTISPECIES: hypothetical protein [Stenotrophomonas]MBP2482924.1 hypothetical protein [Stenotrophomonas sp. PvP093]OWR35288.1 hypothetical protein CEE55_02465 [Stenotrophomonas pavanii]
MTAKRPTPTIGCDMATGPDLTSVAEIVDGKVINVRHLPRQDPLTKKSEVLQVLQAGGRIAAGHRPGLLQLLGADDSPIPAWQTALKAAQASTAQSGDHHEPQ